MLRCDPGTYAAAKFDLEKRAWSTVEIPAELNRFTTESPDSVGAIVHGLGATSDGRAALQLGNYGEEQYWTYTPATDEWAQLPDPGVRSDAIPCVAQDRLFVLTTRYEHNGAVVETNPMQSVAPGEIVFASENDGYVQPSLAILELRDPAAWRLSGPAEGTKFTNTPPRLVCMDAFAAAVSRLSPSESLTVYNIETDAWSLPPPPPIPLRTFTGEVWTGKELVFLPVEFEVGAPGPAYDPVANGWRSLSGFPAVTRGAIWNGSAIVGYSEPLSTSQPLAPDIPTDPATRNAPGAFRYTPDG